jgi:hypothetical protein
MPYVYEHRPSDSNAPFYVGRGTGPRAYEMERRSFTHKQFQRDIYHRGAEVMVTIIARNLTDRAAKEVEKRTIIEYCRQGLELANDHYVDDLDLRDERREFRRAEEKRLLAIYLAERQREGQYFLEAKWKPLKPYRWPR